MLVFFSAEWVSACKEQQRAFADPKLAAPLTRFVGVLVDMTDTEAPKAAKAQRDHEVQGLPTTLLIDSTGREARRITQLEPVEKWLEWLPDVK